MKTILTLIIDHDEALTDCAVRALREVSGMPYVRFVEIRQATTSNDLITLPVIEMPEEGKTFIGEPVTWSWS